MWLKFLNKIFLIIILLKLLFQVGYYNIPEITLLQKPNAEQIISNVTEHAVQSRIKMIDVLMWLSFRLFYIWTIFVFTTSERI